MGLVTKLQPNVTQQQNQNTDWNNFLKNKLVDSKQIGQSSTQLQINQPITPKFRQMNQQVSQPINNQDTQLMNNRTSEQTNQQLINSFGQIIHPINQSVGQSFVQSPNSVNYKITNQPISNDDKQYNAILARLQTIVNVNKLHGFYQQQDLNRIAEKVSKINFHDLMLKWNLGTLELAFDLASLSLYDVIIFADDSGSMIFYENGERIEDLKFILKEVSKIATLFDDDGILIRFLNSNQEFNSIKSEQEAIDAITNINFSGTTPLGINLTKKILEPIVYNLARSNSLVKPILIIIITDGEPDNKNDVRNAIYNSKKIMESTKYGSNSVAFEFAQVGKDKKAQEYLATLDKDPIIGKMVDATSNYELEEQEFANKGIQLRPHLWLLKMLLGAIDPSYDEQDE